MKTASRILATFAICATACTANAAVFVSESFQNYSTGTLSDNTTAVNATGLTGNIQIAGNTSNTATIESGTMSYSNGSLSLDGGNKFLRITAANTSATGVNLALSPTLAPAGGSFYMSFLTRFNGTLNSGDIGQGGFQSNVETGANVSNNVGTQINGSTFRTNVGSGNASSSSGVVVAGNVNFVVIEYISSGTQWTGANVWLNPSSATLGAATYTVSGTNSTTWVALASTISQLEAGDSVDFDRYTLGTTSLDVIPEPTASVLLVGGLVLGNIFRRRRSA